MDKVKSQKRCSQREANTAENAQIQTGKLELKRLMETNLSRLWCIIELSSDVTERTKSDQARGYASVLGPSLQKFRITVVLAIT